MGRLKDAMEDYCEILEEFHYPQEPQKDENFRFIWRNHGEYLVVSRRIDGDGKPPRRVDYSRVDPQTGNIQKLIELGNVFTPNAIQHPTLEDPKGSH